MNEKNEKNFYLFDKEKNEILNKFIPLNINNNVIYVIDKDTKVNGVISKQVKINEEEVNCYEFKANNNYCILNVINSEGKHLQYLYETSENTIQLLPSFLLKENKNSINFNIIMYICICIALMTIPLIIIVFLLRKIKKDEKEINEAKELINKMQTEKIKKKGKKNEKNN